MASSVLYPPTINDSAPAFVYGAESKCKIYFSLSKFNSREDFTSVHLAIYDQKTGLSVVNKENKNKTAVTGIIIDIADNLIQYDTNKRMYYVEIDNEDIIGGWIPGTIYKVQIRLSEKTRGNGTGVLPVSQWLVENGNSFSEWSTICITKSIGHNKITVPSFNYIGYADGQMQSNIITSMSELNFSGTYENIIEQTKTLINENLYSYDISLFSMDSELLEESGVLYCSEKTGINQFSYNFKYEPENETTYLIKFHFITENNYEGTLYFEPFIINIGDKDVTIEATTLEDNKEIKTSLMEEEETGKIRIKLRAPGQETYTGSLIIKRTDETTDFQIWEDIKIYVLFDDIINDVPYFDDYTITSGIKYRYGVQLVSTEGLRTKINKSETIVSRVFEYAFLLGDNGKQLTLKFNSKMSSFKINVQDTKTDTIGGKYPFVTRNGNMYYKTFPVTGTATMFMDEYNTFYNLEEQDKWNNMYNSTYERKFREELMNFIYNGKPKLYKSRSEGNVIVRITDINFTPNDQLGRLVYEMSANATEIADLTFDNLAKYDIYNKGEVAAADDFAITVENQLGTLTIGSDDNIFYADDSRNTNFERNIIRYIKNSINSDIGRKIRVTKIRGVNIAYFDAATQQMSFVQLNIQGAIKEGNKITVNGNAIYSFDTGDSTIRLSGQEFTPDDVINIYGGVNSSDTRILQAYVSFIYDMQISLPETKIVASQTKEITIAEYANTVQPNYDICNDIKERFTFENDTISIEMQAIYRVAITGFNTYEDNDYVTASIDAYNNAMFQITFASGESGEYSLNETEMFEYSSEDDYIVGMKYLGIKNEFGELVKKQCNLSLTFWIVYLKTKYTYLGGR